MQVSPFFDSEWPISIALSCGLLPWVATVLYIAGAIPALNFLAYALVVFLAGYGLLCLTLTTRPASAIALCPAIGILVISAFTAFWVRLGLPLVTSIVVWFVLAIAGIVCLWRDRVSFAKCTLPHALGLTVLSILICTIYFAPSAAHDMVQHRDGSFTWKYRDTQHFEAIAASIKNGGSPPKTPGTATAELLYHFGPYAPAAAISRFDQLNLGDALVRVTRGASLWALLLATFGVGMMLSAVANGSTFGGIMAVAGLYFYGSLSALFAGDVDPSGHWTGGVILTIPDVAVYGYGGPFGYMLSGHSLLHGLVAIAAVMGLCLAEREKGAALQGRTLFLVVLPALVVPMNSVAALYCVAVAFILLFWGRIARVRSVLSIVAMLFLFFAAWKLMGYGHSPDAAHPQFNFEMTQQWWMIVVWFLVGLGMRIIAFGWISKPLQNAYAALVLASVIGLFGFFLLFQLRDGNQRYGIHFLQSLLSVFAFSRLGPGFWRFDKRSELITKWLRIARGGLIVLVMAGALIGIAAVATRSHTGIHNFGPKILATFVCLLVLWAASWWMRAHRSTSVVSAGLTVLLLVGFLAWTPDWLKYGLGQVKTDITYPPGVVRGLQRLNQLMAPEERFATNKHDLDLSDGLPWPTGRSYGYSALAEHPALLEGYLDRGENNLPWFPALLHDNDSLFTTTDPDTLRQIARQWKVGWLVARPGTDIALPRPLPAWLVQQPDCGDLRIYRIN